MALYNIITNNKFLSVFESHPERQYRESYVFMNEAEYEYFEERTAIMEYEGGLKKEVAERLVYEGILQNRKIYSQAS
ncbi:MAG: hypothetical protein JW956_03960 [Calditrichaceae bacterium]|nr:hypothetical protein [Calditrichaceae bacterium]